jgi:predicted aminopeptidase
MKSATSTLATTPAPQSASRQPAAGISLDDRLRYGWFSIDEACQLKGCSRSSFYADARAGHVSYEKQGRRSRVYGPILAQYLATSSTSGE